MQILSRRLLRRPKVAPVRHRVSPPSRPPLSTQPRRWPPALVRQDAQPMAVVAPHVSGFPHDSWYMASSAGVKSEELHKSDRSLVIPSVKDVVISLGERSTKELIAHYGDAHPALGGQDKRKAIVNAISGNEDVSRTSLNVMDGKHNTAEEFVDPLCILPNSSHRDGSLYTKTGGWKTRYCVMDRYETLLEAMMLSDCTDFKFRSYGECTTHMAIPMLQIFSVKMAKIPVDDGSIQLYGYIAVRDMIDGLLNYVIKFSRDDPITVEQGSLINIAGPKRGIDFCDTVLIEYDMRIKAGKQEKDDLQLIDGASILGYGAARTSDPTHLYVASMVIVAQLT
ncbi:hypothetical protein ACP4OV_009703 [Aristida adscensionis]